MTTLKFKEPSPFQGIKERKHDVSDFKYSRFTQYFAEADGPVAPPVGLALFGLGRAGSIHLANIIANPRVNLRYVVEMNRDIWASCREKWSLQDTVFLHPDQADRVYTDQTVQAVIVATPTFTHEEIIMCSLDAGKTVFSEKPISQEPSGTARCYAKSKQVGKPLFCAFNRRFDPSFACVKEKVAAGKLGHVHRIKTVSRDSPLPSLDYLKISGGIFHDCAVHDIDMITWIVGEYPIEVYTAANAQIPEIAALNDWDNVSITLKFASGSIGSIDISRFANYGYDQRLEVFGQKGMLYVKNESPNNEVYSGSGDITQAPIYYSFPSRHHDGYNRELDHFLDILQKNAPMSVTDRMTAAVSKIADACEESAKSGLPVSLSWKAEEIPDNYLMLSE